MTPETVGATLLAVRSEKKLSRKALLEQLGGKPWSTGRIGDLEKGKHPWSYFRPAERATLVAWLEQREFDVAALGVDVVDTSRPGAVVVAERLGVDHLVYGDDGSPVLELVHEDDEPHLLELVEVVVSAPEAAPPPADGADATAVSLPPLQPGWEERVDATVAAMAVEAVHARLAGRTAPFAWPTLYRLDAAPPSDLERVMRWCERTLQWLDDVDSGRPAYQLTDGESVVPAVPTAPPATVPPTATRGGAVTAAVPVEPPSSVEVPQASTTTGAGAAALTVDGVRRVTNSELQTFKHCRRRWWFSWYRGLRLLAEPPGGPRGIGTWVHEALAEWYVPEGETPRDPRLAYDELVSAAELDLLTATAHLTDTDVATKVADFQKDADTGRAMVEGYVEWLAETGADVGLTVVAPEQVLSTLLECSTKLTVRVQGRLDVRLRRDSDLVHLFMDHKPQPLSAPVLTPTGWVKLGELEVGDVISGAHGEPVRVTAVYDRGVDDVYTVTLNDRTTVEATSDHPWVTKVGVNGTWQILPTDQLRPKRHRLASFDPQTDNRDAELSLDPYTLGAWIANGSKNGSTICDGVRETVAATGLPVRVHPPRHPGYSEQYTVKLTLDQRLALDELNLLGLGSPERFIPRVYLQAASYRQRLALLRSLMDADGTLTTTHSAQYMTTSVRLAEDVADLARTLGAWARVWHSNKPCHVGTVADGYDTETYGHNVSIRSTFNPFAHVAHAERWTAHRQQVQGHKGVKSLDKIVWSVEWSRREEVRCIEVDSVESLYVTSGYTVSHNTVSNFTDPARRLPMDEQMKTYLLLEQAHAGGASYVDGALYNLLRRVKRTGTAKPPFYQRLEVRHNPTTVATFRERLRGQALTIDLVEQSLNQGVDHHLIAYPSPSDRCLWGCEYVSVCNMFDDGSRAEDFIAEHYVQINPMDRYDHEKTNLST